MDIATMQSLRNHLAGPHRACEHLIQLLREDAGDALHVREARDRLTSVLRQVRKGKVQVIGTDPRNQVVLIAAKDLCDLLVNLQEQPSFMEALRAMPGYDPPKRRMAFANGPAHGERFHSEV